MYSSSLYMYACNLMLTMMYISVPAFFSFQVHVQLKVKYNKGVKHVLQLALSLA